MDTPAPFQGKILLVEDEEAIASFVATELRFEGYDVRIEADGLRGVMAARQMQPDLVLLDVMLPTLDGLEVCRRLRRSSDVPIIMLTARDQVAQRVEGLEAGANDYVPKPFAIEELLARIRAQLRARAPQPKTCFELSDLSLDLESREVARGPRRLELTPKEFDLLSYMIRHRRQVLTRDQLMTNVWGYDFTGDDNVLEVYIRYLRNKIEGESSPRLIHTVRGVGYVLREEPQ